MIYASEHFASIRTMNRLREEDIDKIIKTHNNCLETAKYSRKVTIEEIANQDFNLNVTRYIDVFEPDKQIEIQSVYTELLKLTEERSMLEEKIKKYLSEIGIV